MSRVLSRVATTLPPRTVALSDPEVIYITRYTPNEVVRGYQKQHTSKRDWTSSVKCVLEGAEPWRALCIALLLVLHAANHHHPSPRLGGGEAGVQVECKSARPLRSRNLELDGRTA
eukprot:6184148-Pleurochrysis_carterae.AAC.1